MTDEFTAEQILQGIAQALKDREIEVVPGLIRFLAVKDPSAAQAVLDAFDIVQLVRR